MIDEREVEAVAFAIVNKPYNRACPYKDFAEYRADVGDPCADAALADARAAIAALGLSPRVLALIREQREATIADADACECDLCVAIREDQDAKAASHEEGR